MENDLHIDDAWLRWIPLEQLDTKADPDPIGNQVAAILRQLSFKKTLMAVA